MPKKTSLSVNLLPRSEQTFTDHFLRWSLTFGRYIIIGTEIIVLLAFLSRFKLDRDSIDLNDSIKANQQVLNSFKATENSITLLQRRISEIKTLEDKQSSAISVLSQIANLTPNTITFKTISINLDKLSIIGTARDVNDVSAFALQLKNSPLFKKDSVNIDNIEQQTKEASNGQTQGNQGIKFTLSAVAGKSIQGGTH